MSEERRPFSTPLSRLLLLFGLALINGLVFSYIGIALAKLLTGYMIDGDFLALAEYTDPQRTAFLIVTSFASIGTFGISSFMMFQLSRLDALPSLTLDLIPLVGWVLLIAALALLMQPTISSLTEALLNFQSPLWMKEWYEAQIAEHVKQSNLFDQIISGTNYSLILLSILVVAIVPAIVEEVFFRGVLLRIIGQMSGNVHIGAIVSALIFGLFHQQLLQLPALFFAGLLFSYVFIWTGNLWYPIILHFVNNLLGVLLLVLGKFYPDIHILRFEYSYTLSVTTITAVLLAGLCFMVYRKRIDFTSNSFVEIPTK